MCVYSAGDIDEKIRAAVDMSGVQERWFFVTNPVIIISVEQVGLHLFGCTSES